MYKLHLFVILAFAVVLGVRAAPEQLFMTDRPVAFTDRVDLASVRQGSLGSAEADSVFDYFRNNVATQRIYVGTDLFNAKHKRKTHALTREHEWNVVRPVSVDKFLEGSQYGYHWEQSEPEWMASNRHLYRVPVYGRAKSNLYVAFHDVPTSSSSKSRYTTVASVWKHGPEEHEMSLKGAFLVSGGWKQRAQEFLQGFEPILEVRNKATQVRGFVQAAREAPTTVHLTK